MNTKERRELIASKLDGIYDVIGPGHEDQWMIGNFPEPSVTHDRSHRYLPPVKGEYIHAVDANGNSVVPWYPSAVKWNLTGAIMMAADKYKDDRGDRFPNAWQTTVMSYYISRVIKNKYYDRLHAEVKPLGISKPAASTIITWFGSLSDIYYYEHLSVIASAIKLARDDEREEIRW